MKICERCGEHPICNVDDSLCKECFIKSATEFIDTMELNKLEWNKESEATE